MGRIVGSKVDNLLKLRLIYRTLSRKTDRISVRQRVGRVLLYSGSGTAFLWDKERICDWEIDECLADHDKESTLSSRSLHHNHLPVSPSTSLSHQSEIRSQAPWKKNLPEKLLSMQKHLKNIVVNFAKRTLDGSVESVDMPRVFLFFLSFILPPSSLFSSAACQPSHKCFSSPRAEELASVLATLSKKCKEIKHSIQSPQEESSSVVLKDEVRDTHKATRTTPLVSTQPTSSNSKPLHVSTQSMGPENKSRTTASPSTPQNSLQPTHENVGALPWVFSAGCSSGERYKGAPSKLSETLCKLLLHFGNTSADLVVFEDFSVRNLDGEVHRDETKLLHFEKLFPSESEWDLFLDAPPLSIQEHLQQHKERLSSRSLRQPPLAYNDSFVITVGGSLFSDSFCLFDTEPHEFKLGCLYEVGHINLSPLLDTDTDSQPDEALLYVGSTASTSHKRSTEVEGKDTWILQLERMGTKVYYRPLEGSSVYEYRVIGSFKDISGADFAKVQIEPELRKQWDKFVLNMNIIDRDPQTGSEVLHWTAKLPFPLKNRDYVFVRRTQLKRDNRVIVMISRTTEHPKCPETSSCVRVNEFSSRMIIEANSNVYENGFKYELIYIDNPKCTIPSALSSWATSSGIPDYMNKIHASALDMKKSGTKQEALTV